MHTSRTNNNSSSNNNNNNNNNKSNKVPSSSMFQHKFSVAPMMEYTDCYKRQLQRLLTHQAVLYTEIVAANAITT